MSKCRCAEYSPANRATAICSKHDGERFAYKFHLPTEYTTLCSTVPGRWCGVCFDCHMREYHQRQWCEGVGYGQQVDRLLGACEGEGDT